MHVAIIRHSKSDYNNYLVVEEGGDPNHYVDYRLQVADLNAQGVLFAALSAIQFREATTPIHGHVAVLTSGEMRAYQTAQKYLSELERNGSLIHTDSGLETCLERCSVGVNTHLNQNYETGENRVILDPRIIPVRFASLRYRALWIQDMFEPYIGSPLTTFHGLSEERITNSIEREHYRLAREIIEQERDSKAGWGDNWFKYRDQFPFSLYTPTVGENHRLMLEGLLNLHNYHFATEEAKRPTLYLIFTHEENLLGFTTPYFGNARVPNCSFLQLQIPDTPQEFMYGTFEGVTKKMSTLRTYVAEKKYRES